MRAAQQQVQMYVRFLQNPEAFTRLGARMPKGCLLAGPPGTGKTHLAKAVAGTAGVPFYAASGSDFMELFVGQGARSVRELFQAARKAAPAVIFIDELDAVGSKRTNMDTSGEHTRTINQLLADMDGMALTNVVCSPLDRPPRQQGPLGSAPEPPLVPARVGDGRAPNPPIHAWRIPSSKGDHVRPPGSTTRHTPPALMASPPPLPAQMHLCLTVECITSRLHLSVFQLDHTPQESSPLMPDCGVHYLWFAFVYFLIRSPPPPCTEGP